MEGICCLLGKNKVIEEVTKTRKSKKPCCVDEEDAESGESEK